MTKEEIIEEFIDRHLNIKTNNLILVSNDKDLIDEIPERSKITFIYDEFDIREALNIKINLKEVNVKDILNYVLLYLEVLRKLDKRIELELSNTLSLFKFEKILKDNAVVVQLIFHNLECLTTDEQMLFNELYYYNSSYFNVTTIITNELKTYFLAKNRVLDCRDNYQKFYLLNKHL